MPERIQLRRTKGWRKPEGTVTVARPTRWGNPFTVGTNPIVFDQDYGLCSYFIEERADAVQAFRRWLDGKAKRVGFDDDRGVMLHGLPELRGRDLACWCPLDEPCHADVLLEMANAAEQGAP